MDTLTQRLPLEVYQLVDKTIIEVENRHSLDLRNLLTRREQRGFTFDKSEANAEVLADLLWTLYSKLAAVLSGHRIVHDCVLAIVKESKNNDNLADTPEFNYIEVWKPIQSEVYPLHPRCVVNIRYDRITRLPDERSPCDVLGSKHNRVSQRDVYQTKRQRCFKGSTITRRLLIQF
jgi:exocyst complex component 4